MAAGFVPLLTNTTSLLWRYPEIPVAVFCLAFLLVLNRRRDPTPTNWPIVGMLPAVLSNLHRVQEFATDIINDANGCTFLFKGVWFSGMDLLITCDPANVNHIFNFNFANYPKGDEFHDIFDIFGESIFTADYGSWKAQRRMMHGLMAEQRFRRYVVETSYDKVRKGLVPLLEHVAEKGLVIDLQDVFLRFTFDVTSMLVMAVDPGCLSPLLPAVPYARAIDDAEEVLFYRHIVPRPWWKLTRWMGVGEERKMAAARETIDGFIHMHVSMKKEGMRRKFVQEDEDKALVVEQSPIPDLLSSYLDGKALEDKRKGIDIRSNAFLRDTVVSLMLAGRDATAVSLSWFFWLLSKNPRVEAKILEELRANPGVVLCDGNSSTGDQYFDPPDLSSLVYLHTALNETLRLYPPIPFERKGVVQPDVLPSGHEVSPKSKILVFMYPMARVEGVWGKDCREFKPERWVSDHGKIRNEPSYKFMAFNSGPRTCLGKDTSFMQMKAVAATILSKFEINAVEGHHVVPKNSIILHMKNGMKVRVKKKEMLF